MSAAASRRLLILFRRFAETLAYAAGGAAAFGLAGLPAGWLSGAIVGVSAAALSGREVFVPPQVGRIVYVILGISLGSSVTPETVATMVTWPLSMLALAIAMTAVTLSVMAYLKFVHGWPTLDALFAAAPGALAQAMALAQDTGANAPLMQSLIELAVLTIVSAGAGWLAYRFRMPGGLIVGAMAASGVLHGSGWVHAFLPVPVAICSFIVMGAMIG